MVCYGVSEGIGIKMRGLIGAGSKNATKAKKSGLRGGKMARMAKMRCAQGRYTAYESF